MYSSPNIIIQMKLMIMKWAGHAARMPEERKVYKVIVENPEEKTPFGRPRRRFDGGIRMDLREFGCGEWSGFSWLRVGGGVF
jgi:hypothetical protein